MIRFTITFDHRKNPVIVDGVTGDRVVKPFATADRCRVLVDEMNATASPAVNSTPIKATPCRRCKTATKSGAVFCSDGCRSEYSVSVGGKRA